MSWTLRVVVAVVTVLSLARTPAIASPPGGPQTQDQSTARPHGDRGDIFGHTDVEAAVLVSRAEPTRRFGHDEALAKACPSGGGV